MTDYKQELNEVATYQAQMILGDYFDGNKDAIRNYISIVELQQKIASDSLNREKEIALKEKEIALKEKENALKEKERRDNRRKEEERLALEKKQYRIRMIMDGIKLGVFIGMGYLGLKAEMNGYNFTTTMGKNINQSTSKSIFGSLFK